MHSIAVGQSLPTVSVLMPTFKHGAFIRRALESLRAQTFEAWELIIVDDGSPDDTAQIVAPYLSDPRVHYTRLARNGGLGAALNLATSQARGRYLAYLPSDDVYYPDHLAHLVAALDSQPEVYLAYGGVRWQYQKYGPTLQGEAAVGREGEALNNGNILALVQVMHRRDLEGQVRWPTRREIVSDLLEDGFWRGLLAQGVRFAYSGDITCEWVDHPNQRHKIIALPGGVSRYRSYYDVPTGEFLNYQPSRGPAVDERARYGRFAEVRSLPRPGGLKILVVGELGFNPERLLALEEQGHKLYGLWISTPESWDAIGPFAWGNIETIPNDEHWRERVLAVRPDVIYALLNWQALHLIDDVLDAKLGIPLVFHFKEGPFVCLERGLWPQLMRALLESDGRVLISAENQAWYEMALDRKFDPATTMILDGDLPKRDYFTDDWSPKLSARDGEVHTVCTGRPLGLDPFEDIARARIHVHFYGKHFHQQFPNWTRNGLASGYMHIHDTVEPADWVRELSQYDAAWFHVFGGQNRGDLRRSNWDDLNLPARIGTYAAAGLPWILKDARPSKTAIQNLAMRHDVGVFFRDFADLGKQLRDRRRMAKLTQNMRAARHQFAFDTHVDELVTFLRRVTDRRFDRVGAAPVA